MSDYIAAQTFGIGSQSANWNMRLASYMEAQANTALQGSPNASVRGHADALRQVVSVLRQMRFDIDTALFLLGTEVFRATGRGLSVNESYVPSQHARTVINHVGKAGIPHVSAETTLLAWAAAELRDHATELPRAQAKLTQAQETARVALAGQTSAEEKLSVVDSARQSAEQELTSLGADNERLQAQVEFLRGHVAALANGEATTAEPAEIAEPASADAFPTEAQLTEVFEDGGSRRVRIAEGMSLRRSGGDTLYESRIGGKVYHFGSATDGNTTIAQALAARKRIIDGKDS